MAHVCTEDLSPLLHQVAGCHSGIPSNILINQAGQIFKPYKPFSNPTYNNPDELDLHKEDLVPVTLNEFQFYTQLQESKETDFVTLKALSPKYYGSTKIKEIEHLILEDFTWGMKYPCVMDIKLGKDRHYPGRLKEKAKQDTIKYPCLQEFGFCLAGIKLWNNQTGEVEIHHMPKVTRQFSSDEVKRHIKLFLRVNEKFDDGSLRKKIIEDTKAIQNWSSRQRSFILRGSSLLFVYDSAGCPFEEGQTQGDLRARVGTIDFAHIFHSHGTKDENYDKGLNNLMDFLESC